MASLWRVVRFAINIARCTENVNTVEIEIEKAIFIYRKMNIFNYIALFAAAVNVVLKIISKHRYQSVIYSGRNWKVNAVRLRKKYNMGFEERYIAIFTGTRYFYSFMRIFIACDLNANYRTVEKLAEELARRANVDILSLSGVKSRIGTGNYLMLVDSLPRSVREPSRNLGYSRIKPEYSVFRVARYAGGIDKLKSLLHECANYMMYQQMLDGTLPADCVEMR